MQTKKVKQLKPTPKEKSELRRSKIMLAKTFEIGELVKYGEEIGRIVAFFPAGTRQKDAWAEYLQSFPNAIPFRALSIHSASVMMTHRYYVLRKEQGSDKVFCPLLENMTRITKCESKK